jgi:hypothetical protein
MHETFFSASIYWDNIKQIFTFPREVVVKIFRCKKIEMALWFFVTFSNKKKGKVIPLHAMEALGVREGIAPTHS